LRRHHIHLEGPLLADALVLLRRRSHRLGLKWTPLVGQEGREIKI
jgi:hypothetical protein